MYINALTFRQWWDVFHSDNPLTEIRLLGTVNSRKRTASGYFTDCETALRAIQEYPEELGVYAPINEIKQSCYGKSQHDVIIDSPASTTSGNDIEGRRWILLDFDPKRAADTNATDIEKNEARKTMVAVGSFLRDQGFTAPVVADSANGYHLLYRISLANSTKTDELVKNILTVLDMNYSNEFVDIDLQVSDPNRIAKVYGTKTIKGADTGERPRRESKFIKVPDEIEITDVEVLYKIAAMLPQTEAPNRFNGYRTDFDINSFIDMHQIGIAKTSRFSRGTKLTLEHCPFDHNHTAPDAALFIMDSGAIGFKCLHNSCSGYTWKDVRLHYDPSAYSQRDLSELERKKDFYSTAPRPAPIVVEESDEKGKKWQVMKDIEWQDPNKLTYIPTGFLELDRKMGGLCLGDVTLISGIAGSGKSTIANCLILSAIQHGYKVSVWSGELAPMRFKSWLNQNAAGANFVRKSSGESDYWYCPQDVAKKIDTWTDGKLFLYNNVYGNHSSQIISDIKDCIRDKGTQLVILDNKMAMQLDSWTGDKNEREAGLINELKDFAIQSNIHIVLICHPRKEQMNSLLRMESIAGNSDLYNCAANVLLCHRVGRDFERRASDFFGKEFIQRIVSDEYNEVIEIAKNRTHGAKDSTIGLFYETKTRRYKNSIAEYVVFGWQESGYVPVIPNIDIKPNYEFSNPGGADEVEQWEREDLPV